MWLQAEALYINEGAEAAEAAQQSAEAVGAEQRTATEAEASVKFAGQV